jgi:hypothetical protein
MILIARNLKNNRVVGLQVDGKLFKLAKSICHAIELDEKKRMNNKVSHQKKVLLSLLVKNILNFSQIIKNLYKKCPPAKRVLNVIACRISRAWAGAKTGRN